MITDVNQVWDYYLHRSQEMTNLFENPKVLKVDGSNESGDLPLKGGIAGNIKGEVYCLELNESVVREALVRSPALKIQIGDVRAIPFEPKTFDLILDLSTIDHIPYRDLDKVLSEYQRVLKDRGRALIISWLTLNPKYKVEQAGWSGRGGASQFYFQEQDFIDLLWKHFKVDNYEKIYQKWDIFLGEAVLSKKPEA